MEIIYSHQPGLTARGILRFLGQHQGRCVQSGLHGGASGAHAPIVDRSADRCHERENTERKQGGDACLAVFNKAIQQHYEFHIV
jgi:hypothetical protein